MPIIPRRQLQQMLNDLGPWLLAPKAKDLLGRIESDDPDQALPGEYELALAWAVSKVAHLEIDVLAGTRRPDIYSLDLMPGGPIAIEVTAMSDDPLSREPLMRRAAQIINQEANRTRKGSQKHLHYTFSEQSGYLPRDRHSNGFQRYYRRPSISKDFKITAALKTCLAGWLGSASTPLRYTDEHIDVIIEWRDWVHWMGNTHCSMPAVTYDIRDNPLYDLLKAKAKQLKNVPIGTMRGIFLGDAGCSLLRNIRPSTGGREVSGDQIIRKFLERNAIDLVAVFVPKRANENATWQFDNPRYWHTYIYSRTIENTDSFTRILKLREHLPNPHLHGYQARSWHQQGMTKPQARGQYLGARWTGGRGKMTVQISSRGLQEFLAGRLTHEQFKKMIIGDRNPFEFNLARGRMISSVQIEYSGLEKDDDAVIFEFKEDPAAGSLMLPSTLRNEL